MSTRSEALAIQQLALDEGMHARVVRRYIHGVGWEYVVVVEELADRESAEKAAEVLAEKGGRGITVYRREGTEGRRVGGVGTPGTGPGGLDPTAVAVTDSAAPELPSAATVLEQAVRALGGREGGLARLAAAENLRFSYERTVRHEDKKLVAKHLLLRTPDGIRLEVEGVQGVVSSISVVGPEGAWVEVEGKVTAREPERVLEVLEAFSPEELLAYPLEFARLVDTEPAYGLLRTMGQERLGDVQCWRLEYTGPEVGGTMTLLVEDVSWRIASVGFTTDGGHVRYLFADYRELDTGLVAPFDVALERDGERVETLAVQELSLPAELSGDLFTGTSPGPSILP